MPGPKRPSKPLAANNFALYESHIVWVELIDGVNASIKFCKGVGKNAETGKVVSYGKIIPVFVSELIAI